MNGVEFGSIFIINSGKGSVSEALAERRSMVAGILQAGPPKKNSQAKKYKRADTLPIQTTERSEVLEPKNFKLMKNNTLKSEASLWIYSEKNLYR